MITNLMLAAALTGVHTPETSKLFERRIDPESGVVSYSLVYGAPDGGLGAKLSAGKPGGTV